MEEKMSTFENRMKIFNDVIEDKDRKIRDLQTQLMEMKVNFRKLVTYVIMKARTKVN